MASANASALAKLDWTPPAVDSIYTVERDGSGFVAGVPLVRFANHWCQIARAYVNTNESTAPPRWELVYEDSIRLNPTSLGNGVVRVEVTKDHDQNIAVEVAAGDGRKHEGTTPFTFEHWYGKSGRYEVLAHNPIDGQYLYVNVDVPQPTFEHHLILTRVGTTTPEKWHIEVIVPDKANDRLATFALSINGVMIDPNVRLTNGVGAIEHQFAAGDSGDQNVAITYTGQVNTLSGVITLAAAGKPTVTHVTPSFGKPAGGNTVTVEGTNFVGVTSVRFGSDEGTNIQVIDTEHLTVDVPASLREAAVDVTVVAAGGVGILPTGYMYKTLLTAAPFLVPSNELQDYLEDGSEMVPLMAGGPPALVTDGTAIFAVGLQGNVPAFGANDARVHLRAASAAGTFYRMYCYSDDDTWDKVMSPDGTVKSWGLDRVKSTIIKDIDPNSPEAHYGTYFSETPIHPFKYGTNADDNWTDGSGHAPEFGGIVPPRKYWAQDQIEIQAATSNSAATDAVNFIVVIFTLS